MDALTQKIVLPGGAGLVGQNLVARLLERGYTNLVVIDKHHANLQILRQWAPQVHCVEADLSQPGAWFAHFAEAAAVVMLQAQIGGPVLADFVHNNVDATANVLDVLKAQANPAYLVHISSSVVESVADDFYTNTKKDQEALVLRSGVKCPILRPTLMFGWFDRKHLGWLSRFMQRTPVFPIPGNGRYMRQPLYVGDFCGVIISCIERRVPEGIFNISGIEKVDYVDIIREIKRVTHARAAIAHLPYHLFYALLWIWGKFDANPPFTTQQLAALIARDEFEVIDWPGLFGVRSTPFAEALEETFLHPVHGKVILEF